MEKPMDGISDSFNTSDFMEQKEEDLIVLDSDFNLKYPIH